MKLFHTVLTVALLSVSSVSFGQSDAQKPMDHSTGKAPVVKSETEKAFDKLKTLAGSWEGQPETMPPVPELKGKSAQVKLRVASRGHTLMHDLKIEGIPDNPLTMVVVDADRLLLTHYCDGDNRPRMLGKMSPDGKTVEFDFLDISGRLGVGHMHHVVFTFIDENHHGEEWTFMMPGDKPMKVHIELQRTKDGSTAAGQ
jgi:hypothetical protein